MKTRIYTALISAFCIFFATNVSATDIKKEITEKAKSNLITAINSDNEGLKRSAIYFSGQYEVNETLNAMLKLFRNETNPSTRILIVHAIYRIKDSLAMEKIHDLIMTDRDPKVQRLGKAIYETYKLDINANSEFVADIH